MTHPVLLIDFGSTYTKITAVDTDRGTLLQTAQSFTTVETDIRDGLQNALQKADVTLEDFAAVYACSSAAGGLRMAVSGLMPDLTSKAARMAALGAGAKVVRSFSHELTQDDQEEIRAIAPDILLLCGGTDGGNRTCIEHNARVLADLDPAFPIIFAGNRSAKDTCRTILKDRNVYYCDNVLPALDTIRVEEVQQIIRAIFQKNIVRGKGLSQVNEILDRIAMPTPGAVHRALELLSGGTKNTKGWGELLGVDLGGATTDVYSMAAGDPQMANVTLKGLPEPFSKRTVEGDIGMRYSLLGVVEESGYERLAEISGLPSAQLPAMLASLDTEKAYLPSDTAFAALDAAVASEALRIAISRHTGRLEEFYTPMGRQYLQTGKDLRTVNTLIATGGALLHAKDLPAIVSRALYTESDPSLLLPETMEIWLDRNYILSAMGVLSEHDPDAALAILTKELVHVRNEQ